MEEPLKTTEWLFLSAQRCEQWGLQTIARGRWSASDTSQESARNRRRGPAGTCVPSNSSVYLRVSSSKLGSWSSPLTLKFLPGHGLSSSGLLFLFSPFRIPAEGEVGVIACGCSREPAPRMRRTSGGLNHASTPVTVSAWAPLSLH